jgi:hypothetical protein
MDSNDPEQKQATIQAIDAQLDLLIGITGTMKTLASQIGTELTDQKGIVDDLSKRMDTTQGKVQEATTAITNLK